MTTPCPLCSTPAVPPAKRSFARLVAIALLLLTVVAGSGRAGAACTPDIQLNDDASSQSDASGFCSNGTCNVSNFSFSIAMDDRAWTGGNTGDGCLLFDTDADGNANRAICGQVGGAGVLQAGPICYTCGDTRPDRCTSPSVAVACSGASTCSVTVTNDPFVGAPTHAQGNDCNGTQCLMFDTSITCCVTAADRGGASGALLDACTFNSGQPNSNPVDCIISRACGNNVNDPVCNDNNPCTVDTCDTGVGVCNHVPGNGGAVCRTGAGVCDVPETCTGTSAECPADGFAQSGVCRAKNGDCDVAESCNGSGVDCPADGVAPGGVCRTASGACDIAESCDGVSKTCPADQPAPNNTPCNDGNECTNGDVCVAGQCQGGTATVCNDNNPCTDQVCNPNTGACDITNNTASCTDGNACTTGDVCSGGSCVPGVATVCNDSNPCTDQTCNTTTGNCDTTNNTDQCDDGDPCTSGDVCSGGQCTGPGATDCDDTNACTTDSCDSNVPNGCVHASVPACCNTNDQCADSDLCTTNERCENHACVSDPVPPCDDGNVCTDDACSDHDDELDHNGSGCVFTNNSASCTDGNACTNGDVCADGQCQPGSATICNDGNPCTDQICNTTTGACDTTNNTASCSDGNACTNPDVCSGGSCQPGTTVTSCDDGNPCTNEVCNTSTGGCDTTNNTASCDDNNGCTLGDQCSGGSCEPGTTAKVCDDVNICTTDTCAGDPAGTCVFTNNDNQCEDGDVCTLNDICFNGDCTPGPADPCNDHLACTDDICVGPATGCQNTPVAQPCCETDADCIDESGCTVDEACVNNSCVSSPRNCDDGNPCTLDSCTSQSADDFMCVKANCAVIQGQPCPVDHPECIPDRCGNTIVEPNAPMAESCDPPGATTTPANSNCGAPGHVCGDVCRADCKYCGDGVTNPGSPESCDDGNAVTGCDPVHPQQAADGCNIDCTAAICKDPAKITLTDWIDRYDVHGMLPASELVDFGARTLVVELRNTRGKVLYRTALEAGSLLGDVAVGKFKYKNKSAKAWGGLAAVKISRHRDGYRLTATTYGNLYNSGSQMVTNVYSGSDHWSVRGNWSQTKRGWKFKE